MHLMDGVDGMDAVVAVVAVFAVFAVFAGARCFGAGGCAGGGWGMSHEAAPARGGWGWGHRGVTIGHICVPFVVSI